MYQGCRLPKFKLSHVLYESILPLRVGVPLAIDSLAVSWGGVTQNPRQSYECFHVHKIDSSLEFRKSAIRPSVPGSGNKLAIPSLIGLLMSVISEYPGLNSRVRPCHGFLSIEGSFDRRTDLLLTTHPEHRMTLPSACPLPLVVFHLPDGVLPAA